MPGFATLRASRPRWVLLSAWLAIAAALPTVVWRVVVGFGWALGTPGRWWAAEHIPGSGTVYVLVLSLLQLVAALLTLLLVHPRGDHIPGWSPVAPRTQLPAPVVASIALGGATVLVFLCVASAINWGNVDPFRGVRFNGSAALCWACYAVAPLWPVFLIVTTLGYLRSRRRPRHRQPSPV